MSEIRESIETFKKLLDIEYEFVIAHKGKTVTLKLFFEKQHFFHLVGFQHLEDISGLFTESREIIFDKLDLENIAFSKIENSLFYKTIKTRVEKFKNLEKYLDSNETTFKYDARQNSFSSVQADYLMKNNEEKNMIFIFLSCTSADRYFCRSFFSETKKDYSFAQQKWTLLFKKKIHKSTNTEEILFQHKNFKNSESYECEIQ